MSSTRRLLGQRWNSLPRVSGATLRPSGGHFRTLDSQPFFLFEFFPLHTQLISPVHPALIHISSGPLNSITFYTKNALLFVSLKNPTLLLGQNSNESYLLFAIFRYLQPEAEYSYVRAFLNFYYSP